MSDQPNVVSNPLDSLIEKYEAGVADSGSESSDVKTWLAARSEIESQRAALSEEQADRVADADQLLAQKAEQVSQRLTPADANEHPNSEWWWHLGVIAAASQHGVLETAEDEGAAAQGIGRFLTGSNLFTALEVIVLIVAVVFLARNLGLFAPGPTPTPTPFPTSTPTIAPTVNAAAFDMNAATPYKADGDVLEMSVPSGWQTTAQPPSGGQYAYTFTYGGTGPQDALLLLTVQFSDAKSTYAGMDPTGKADSPATALQALIDANSNPQPGAPTITFSKVQPIKVGTLDGQGIIADVPASAQGPEAHYDIRLAALPPDKVISVQARGDVSVWDKGQPIIGKMLDTLVIKPQNVPTATATATLHPLLITATALQTQINGLTPSPTITSTSSPTPVATAGATAAATGANPPVTLQDGLQYVDVTVGTGDAAVAGKTVDVSYTGTLDNGTVFDSSNGKTPPYIEFQLGTGNVIKGWDEGIAGMKVGGERQLTIPAALGYGATGQGPIPANATLHLDVKLVAVK